MREILGTVTLGVAPVIAAAPFHSTTAFFGVEITVVIMSIFGSLIAMSIADPIEPRKKMWWMVLASAFFGVLSVTTVPHVPLMGWTTEIPQPVLGGLGGFFSRWIIPALIESLPAWVKSLRSGGK